MTNTNPKLGHDVHMHLAERGIETPMHAYVYNEARNPEVIEESHRTIMKHLNLDMGDDSLIDTPRRVAKMYMEELFYGLDYNMFPDATAFDNKAHYDEMVLTKCSVFSTCEHHFLPFIGEAYIGYIPGEKILGLSKFSRITDFFSRRPQVQERLTVQIAETLKLILSTTDVAVLIKAEHYCGKVRGVMEHNGQMITSQMNGKFRDVPELRQEFMAATRL